MRFCPQPQRSQLSTGEIAPFRLNSAQMRYPPQAVICASSTGGHRRFVPAGSGYCITSPSSNAPQLQEGRREPFPGRPASLAGLCAKRTAKAGQQTENEFIHFPVCRPAFFCPETRPACFKLQAQFVCSSCFQASPYWGQGADGPLRGFQGRGGPDVLPSILFILFKEDFEEE